MSDTIVTLGIDIGKTWFHLIGLNRREKPVYKKKVKRDMLFETIVNISPRLVGMEACSGSQYIARRLAEFNICAKLMAPQFVKPYLKSQKNDFNDAAAIAEAVTRPTMRFVAVKTQAQLDLQALHRYRDRVIRDKTAATNQIRAFLQENGIIIPTGKSALLARIPDILEDVDGVLSGLMKSIITRIHCRWIELEKSLVETDKEIKLFSKSHHDCQRLMTIPGIGPLSATAIVSAIGNGNEFKNARELAAWIGLVPRQHSTGGQSKLLGITKTGNPYLRKLFIHGARAVIIHSHRKEDRLSRWLNSLESRVHRNKAVVALANKLARICWSVLVSGGIYRQLEA